MSKITLYHNSAEPNDPIKACEFKYSDAAIAYIINYASPKKVYILSVSTEDYITDDITTVCFQLKLESKNHDHTEAFLYEFNSFLDAYNCALMMKGQQGKE